jgi:hypothetical protein
VRSPDDSEVIRRHLRLREVGRLVVDLVRGGGHHRHSGPNGISSL